MLPDLCHRTAAILTAAGVVACVLARPCRAGEDPGADTAVRFSGGDSGVALPQSDRRSADLEVLLIEPGNSMGGAVDGSLLPPAPSSGSSLDPRLLEILNRRVEEANNWLQMDATASDPFATLGSSRPGWEMMRTGSRDTGLSDSPDSLGDGVKKASAPARNVVMGDTDKDLELSPGGTRVATDIVGSSSSSILPPDPALRRMKFASPQTDPGNILGSPGSGSLSPAAPAPESSSRSGAAAVGGARLPQSVRELIGGPLGSSPGVSQPDLIQLTADDTRREINPSTGLTGDGGDESLLGPVGARSDSRGQSGLFRDSNARGLGPSSLSPLVPVMVPDPEKPRVPRVPGGNRVVIPQRKF